ncbi:glycoside hydrolase family 2 TIM barrel-domain containing protein [Paludibacter sp.]|uniref:glycoside hydrolase family 2 protein n=1 Tax=Paludibacter sp. TaxID=1898105 RepID=UPI0013560903|nr:glycoside hydrolase family 2 TIM barrel-domain containing protein [Paludibacter sp.]MTK54635.1 glycosyl hydrolase [Paludibacter sp.]
MKQLISLFLLAFFFVTAFAHEQYELKSGWKCQNMKQVSVTGEQLSLSGYALNDWQPATVPGTVLTTMLNNKQVPDPFFGMNNNKIKDIYYTGRDYYTYWFVKEFKEMPAAGSDQVYLNLRGVNYACDIFLNGKRVNKERHFGMELRQSYNITSLLAKDGNNRLAVIVFPPDPVGNPNGGQGGDGRIAKNLTHQYTAGWDWIQPIRDRNTGIWDKVTIEKTHGLVLRNPHIITLVPGKRDPEAKSQEPAIIKATVEVENPQAKAIRGTVEYTIDGQTVKQSAVLAANGTTEVKLADFTLKNPKLWWPNMYGAHPLYDLKFRFVTADGKVLDDTEVKVGVREITPVWNDHTRSMQFEVNGQKIFIKGGNWIISDEMLRFSPERYDAEIRFHRDMNLNLIRIWGGAIIERPEFYAACDKYGMLVFQDFWFSGDCNGRWVDPMKSEDQWTRRKYPDDHALSLKSMADMVKMIRNHASLAIWCGGNEIPPPADILLPLQDSILPKLDGTRYFFPYSNSDKMSYNSIGGNGDGPYTIQDPKTFWSYRTFPFNSEVGSVGTGDAESLERFLPKENQAVPDYANNKIDSVWDYHKDIGYGNWISLYGNPKNIKEFGDIAQLVNYDQYRALAEGFSAHSWDWYTGFIIWKTQNPWTALRGQMYDYYLDVNACLYGLRNGSEPLHVMCNPVDGMVMIVNNTFHPYHDVMLKISYFDLDGKETPETNLMLELSPTTVQPYLSIKPNMDKLRAEKGVFVKLQIVDAKQAILSENIYWLPDANGNYSGLQQMKKADLSVSAHRVSGNTIEVKMENPAGNPLAFFNRISLVDPSTGKRLMPVFYDDNYVTVLPGTSKTIRLEYNGTEKGKVTVEGWNVQKQTISVQ